MTTADISQLTRVITEVTECPHQHTRLLKGRLQGTISGSRSDNFSVAAIRYTEPVAITTDPRRGKVVVVLPLAPVLVDAGATRWAGSAPFFVSSDRPTTFRPAPGSGAVSFSFDSDKFAERLAAAGARSTAKQREVFCHGESRTLDGGDALRGVLTELCGLLECDSVDRMPDVFLESALFSALAMGLRSQIEWNRVQVPSERYADEAKQWINAHLSDSLCVDDIARAVSLSSRHLNSIFTRHVGMPPSQYLRKRRLERLREILTNPPFSTLTIRAAAKLVGTPHLGRMAADYAKQYGEPPSHTLARAYGSELTMNSM
jgi:AraC-like DNA-binding protein